MIENTKVAQFFRDKLVVLFSEEILKELNVDCSEHVSFMFPDEKIYRLVVRPFSRYLENGNIKHISIDVYKNWFEHFKFDLFEVFPIGIAGWLCRKFPIKYIKENHKIKFDINAWYPKAKLDIDKKHGFNEYHLYVNNIKLDEEEKQCHSGEV